MRKYQSLLFDNYALKPKIFTITDLVTYLKFTTRSIVKFFYNSIQFKFCHSNAISFLGFNPQCLVGRAPTKIALVFYILIPTFKSHCERTCPPSPNPDYTIF